MLKLAVTGIMCIFQARIQEQARVGLARVSRADPLTGVLNQLGFGERIEAELRAAERGAGPGRARRARLRRVLPAADRMQARGACPDQLHHRLRPDR